MLKEIAVVDCRIQHVLRRYVHAQQLPVREVFFINNNDASRNARANWQTDNGFDITLFK